MAQKVILHDENDVQIMPVASTLSVEELSVTDLADIANGGMIKSSGRYFIKDSKLVNAPFDGWYALEVIEGSSEYMGQMRAVSFWDNVEKYTSVNQGKIVGWKKVITDDVNGTLTWQSNMDILKGQMVTFPSLGTAETGLLVNPVFMSLINQNTGSSFPAADSIEGVSGKWKLMNSDAYSIQYTTSFYGISSGATNKGMLVNRVGSQVFAYMNPASKEIGADYGFENFKLPSVFSPMKTSGIASSSTYVKLQEPGTDTSSLLIWDGGSLQTKGSYPNGSQYSGEYTTNAAMIWSAGVPTV